ncbi:anti-sigma factor [Cellulomonas alba]|uniref:Anti-sigma factor n=1 Tax=Cellulomonas alba TaxID=3053467 RepID=A0ABT7SJQ8_9CELL|nr:anti-sigma factor [Cellulomonas alba]MDM7856419.1 anti-sigma factor [Cellulomonas alba]
MSHPDPAELVALSLGETEPTPEQRAHLATCDACATELDALRRVVTAGRSRVPGDEPRAPGPNVWAAIRDELGIGDVAAEPGPPAEPVGTPGVEAPGVEAPPAAPATVTQLRPARRRGLAWAAVAAAAALVVGVVAGVAWADRGRASTQARATLVALPGWSGASGTAELQRTRDGSLQLSVQVDARASVGGFREVWLATPDLRGMVSLGVLDGGSTTLPVPAGLDVAGYPVVDVSEEPFDGDPAHSADSIVRGKLAR